MSTFDVDIVAKDEEQILMHRSAQRPQEDNASVPRTFSLCDDQRAHPGSGSQRAHTLIGSMSQEVGSRLNADQLVGEEQNEDLNLLEDQSVERFIDQMD